MASREASDDVWPESTLGGTGDDDAVPNTKPSQYHYSRYFGHLIEIMNSEVKLHIARIAAINCFCRGMPSDIQVPEISFSL